MNSTNPSHHISRGRYRIEASALLGAMAIGCLALWLAVPVLALWVLSRFVSSGPGYVLLSLPIVPSAVIGFAWILSLANRRYLAISGALFRLEEELDDVEPRRLYGPLESMLPASMVLAVIALVLWIALLDNSWTGISIGSW